MERDLKLMADHLVRESSSLRSVPALHRSCSNVLEPMLPALLRGVIFISILATPFVAALFAG
jgi:hypothetical protein